MVTTTVSYVGLKVFWNFCFCKKKKKKPVIHYTYCQNVIMYCLNLLNNGSIYIDPGDKNPFSSYITRVHIVFCSQVFTVITPVYIPTFSIVPLNALNPPLLIGSSTTASVRGCKYIFLYYCIHIDDIRCYRSVTTLLYLQS